MQTHRKALSFSRSSCRVIPAKAGIQTLDHPVKPDDDKVWDCSQRDRRVAYAPRNDKGCDVAMKS
jgi:hypothetical protein